MDKNYYIAPDKNQWQGRIDGNEYNQLRWHQVVQPVDIGGDATYDLAGSFVLLGFACDEGVQRNKGRVGAAMAPAVLRKMASLLPVHFTDSTKLIDAGDITCTDNNLEEAQQQLSIAVSRILQGGGFPLLIGGGHEILYGHYAGVHAVHTDKKTGIINFDAHFDLREPAETGATSGTGFYQVAQDCKNRQQDFLYFPVGIQKSGNTKELFERAEQLGVKYIPASNVQASKLQTIKKNIQGFINKTDVVCVTIDMDVFDASIAPGVSMPSAGGLHYYPVFYELLQLMAISGKVVSLDIAELNPVHDTDNRTARLAAKILFDWVDLKVGI